MKRAQRLVGWLRKRWRGGREAPFAPSFRQLLAEQLRAEDRLTISVTAFERAVAITADRRAPRARRDNG